MSEEEPFVLTKPCREQKLERVVVFNDRAELKRVLQCDLKPGLNEVHIENVTNRIVPDSVRVDGRGDGIIHDVQLRDKPTIHEETDSPIAIELRERIEEKLKEVNLLKDRETVLKRRIEILDKIVGEIGSNVVSHPDKKEPFIVSQETLENLTKFFSYYEESSVRTRTELHNVIKRLEKEERELSALHSTLDKNKSDLDKHHSSKSVIVSVQSINGGVVQLEVSYQVHGARWTPSYDIRVETAGKPSMKITYFGNISQSTLEDWMNASLVLSTAQPCSGGQLPEPDVIDAIFYRSPPPREQPVLYCSAFGSAPQSRSFPQAASTSVVDSPPVTFGVATAAPMKPHALSTEFTISKPAAIPSDGAAHKVTVGILDVDPVLLRQCVPSKNLSAFLTAFAVNTSQLPLLLGDAAVYLNNSFVSKTTMKNVSPGERFSCSLGIDTALQIEYKPVKKYHEKVGIIAKISSTVHDQLIVVKNTRNESLLLTIKESIPQSTDEQIRVRLISPEIPSSDVAKESDDLTTVAELPKEGPKMNESNILEWTITIPAGKSNELHVKWAVDHPVNETVDFVKRH
ncbi:hypothetical protein RB195_003302 [Necator americanus]|uniref:DUF4139 domain-containing protein n=1 Tax=Necator americanus TaxID=51031 RepID=A0ABR1DMY9_NECAM